jgi:hypothetical protein
VVGWQQEELLQTSVFSMCEYWTINGEASREIQAACVEKGVNDSKFDAFPARLSSIEQSIHFSPLTVLSGIFSKRTELRLLKDVDIMTELREGGCKDKTGLES